MPGPATFITLGAVGAAAYYANWRSEHATHKVADKVTEDLESMRPFTVGRRRSGGIQNDLFDPSKQVRVSKVKERVESNGLIVCRPRCIGAEVMVLTLAIIPTVNSLNNVGRQDKCK